MLEFVDLTQVHAISRERKKEIIREIALFKNHLGDPDLCSILSTLLFDLSHPKRRWTYAARRAFNNALRQISLAIESKPFTLRWPVNYPLNRGNLFGANPELYAPLGYPGHPGIDFLSPVGTPVQACESGDVLAVGNFGTAGNIVYIRHSFGATRYLHLGSIFAEKDSHVNRGTVIGHTGDTGYTTGPHLHMDLFSDDAPEDNGYNKRIDPRNFLVPY